MAEKIKVSSFSTVLTEVAREVGGDKVDVTGHIKPGTDPHQFEPKPSTLKIVAESDIILLSAKHMEAYVGKLREAVGGKGRVVEVGDQFPSMKMKVGHHHHHDGDDKHAVHDHDHGSKPIEDPHWWHSIVNVQRATKIVMQELVRAQPESKAYFTANAAQYDEKLEALKKWSRQKVSELPRDRRKLVTSHDAFNYLAKELGFEVYAVEGLSPADQPSSKDVSELISTIKKEGVKAVFSEDTANPKVLQEITRETGAKLAGSLYADGLGEKAPTYELMYKHNVTTIVDSLK